MRLILLFVVAIAGATAFKPPADSSDLLKNAASWIGGISGSSSSSSSIKTLVPKAPSNFCQGCRSIVSFVSRFNESSMREEYRDLLKDFCELYYPASTDYQQGPCPIFVEGFFYVLNQMDPVHHCDQIGACGASYTSTSMASYNSESPSDDGPICKVCEQVIQQVKQQLEDPDFVKQIQERIDVFCDYLKVVGQDELCKQMLRQNLDEAIEFIEAIEPKKYCQSLSLCPSTGRLQSELKPKLPSLADFSNFGIETSVEMGGHVVKNIDFFDRIRNPGCSFCKTLVKELFRFLRENRTEEGIRDGLDKICALVYPDGPKRDQCDQLVATYSKELVEFLTVETDPELVCIMIQQCVKEIDDVRRIENQEVTMSGFISMLDPTIQVGSLRSCVECKLFVDYLKNTLDGQQSQEQLKEWLIQHLCESLEDENMKSSCKSLVEKRAVDFFNAIANNLNPQATCQELGACRKRRLPLVVDLGSLQSSILLQPFKLVQQPQGVPIEVAVIKKPSKTPFCDGCVQVVSKIDEYLSANSIQNDVNELVTQVCDKLPVEQMQKGCTQLIRYYGNEIMEHISTMDDPLHLCTKITLC